jgi:hypothetical protein
VGVTLFVESPGRRREIAAFTFTHALLSIWRTWGRGGASRVAPVLLFATAVGLLMRMPESQPRFLHFLSEEEAVP